MNPLIRSLIFVFVLFFFTGCKNPFGTDTGNPVHQESSEHDQCPQGSPCSPLTAPTREASLEYVEIICHKISYCNSAVSVTSCQDDLFVQGRVDGIFLAQLDSRTFEELYHEEKSGRIVSNKNLIAACKKQILQMACDDPAIGAAYQPDQPTPYLEGASLLASKEPCRETFSVVEE